MCVISKTILRTIYFKGFQWSSKFIHVLITSHRLSYIPHIQVSFQKTFLLWGYMILLIKIERSHFLNPMIPLLEHRDLKSYYLTLFTQKNFTSLNNLFYKLLCEVQKQYRLFFINLYLKEHLPVFASKH